MIYIGEFTIFLDFAYYVPALFSMLLHFFWLLNLEADQIQGFQLCSILLIVLRHVGMCVCARVSPVGLIQCLSSQFKKN